MSTEPGDAGIGAEEIEEAFEGFEWSEGVLDEGRNDGDGLMNERWSLHDTRTGSDVGVQRRMSDDAMKTEITASNSMSYSNFSTIESKMSDSSPGNSSDMPLADEQHRNLGGSTAAISQHIRDLPEPILPAMSYSDSMLRSRLPHPVLEEIKELPEPTLPPVLDSEFDLSRGVKAAENPKFTSSHIPPIKTETTALPEGNPSNCNSTPTISSIITTGFEECETEKAPGTSRRTSSLVEPDPSTTETATFTISKKGVYKPLLKSRLRNNLMASVGFLEFGNAADFAANVWNTIPVPIYAAVLMGLGGAVAIILSFFALRDGILSWRNVVILKEERKMLIKRDEGLQAKEGKIENGEVERIAEVDAMRLDVSRRELGSEIVDRFSMDVLMGFGALIVGLGTELAIGGANPHIYRASNLLSGYIGNSPGLLWGLGNSIWSVYVFKRAGQHLTLGLAILESQIVQDRLRSRARLMRVHSLMLGLATLLSGPGGMITVTRWWGYVILIPCIIANIYGNILWRRRIGYERPLARIGEKRWARDEIVSELEWVISLRGRLDDERNIEMNDLVDCREMDAQIAVDFIVRCNLFEDFCWRLLMDKTFVTSAEGDSENNLVMITPLTILATPPDLSPLLLSTAQLSLREKGPLQLRWKERYLLEMLGARLCVEDGTIRTDGLREAEAQSRRASQVAERKDENGRSR
jgi:uncharacterized membrane protein YedE/YeeE